MQKVDLMPQHFHGAADLDFAADGIQPWRVKLADRDLTHPAVNERASMPSGIRIVFRANTRNVRLTTMPLRSTSPYDFDLVCDGTLLGSVCKPPVQIVPGFEMDTLADFEKIMGFKTGGDPLKHESYGDLKGYRDTFIKHAKGQAAAFKERPTQPHVIEFQNIPAGEHTLELFLSVAGPQKIQSLEIDAGATATVVHDTRPRWLIHGSSITHSTGLDIDQFGKYGGQTAKSPSRTWPATSARAANVNFTSLGFGGQAVMDTTLAMQIADTPADLISLKLGINVHNMGSHGLRSFGQAVLGVLQTIRDKQPTTPIQLISPIYGAWRETMTHSAIGIVPDEKVARDPRFPTLQQMRTELKRLVETLQARGDKNMHYLDGLQLFGEEDFKKGLMPDHLHPNGEGYELMGRRHAELTFGAGKIISATVASKL